MDKTEQKIIASCQQGDLRKFAWLYQKYLQPIYRFIYYRTLHQQTAEDLTSQTFIKAMQGINGFKQGNFAAWLYQIARHNLTDHYRRLNKQTDINDIWDLADQTDWVEQLDSRLTLEKVQAQLDKLKSEQREIILLRFWDELSYEEIAALVGKSVEACRMAVNRGLKLFSV